MTELEKLELALAQAEQHVVDLQTAIRVLRMYSGKQPPTIKAPLLTVRRVSAGGNVYRGKSASPRNVEVRGKIAETATDWMTALEIARAIDEPRKATSNRLYNMKKAGLIEHDPDRKVWRAPQPQ